MREISYILENLTTTSLVIIDELGRGTSTFDGLGITFAICEKLIQQKCFVFFATHFMEISEGLKIYPNVLNLTFPVAIKNEQIF